MFIPAQILEAEKIKSGSDIYIYNQITVVRTRKWRGLGCAYPGKSVQSCQIRPKIARVETHQNRGTSRGPWVVAHEPRDTR